MQFWEKVALIGGTLLLCATLVLFDDFFKPVQLSFSSAAKPVSSLNRAAVSSISEFFSRLYTALSSDTEQTSRELQKLRKRIHSLEASNAIMRNRLEKLADVPAFAGLQPLQCKVTYYDPVGASEVITLNVGSSDGVKTGMVVCSGDVIVARVYKVAPSVSLAVTCRHRFFKMPILIVDEEDASLARGIAEGNGIALEVRFVPLEQKVTPDAVALSNDESPYVPSGFTIGSVSLAEPQPSTRSWRLELAPHMWSFELEELYIPIGVQREPDMHVPREAR